MRPGGALVEVTRRDTGSGIEVVESVHGGHLAVVDEDGRTVTSTGDPQQQVFARSAVKPLQATACLELLDDASRPTGAELAVAWGSHRAEPHQLTAVEALLAMAGLPVEALTCPAAVGEHDASAPRSKLRHNCSGKHALFGLVGRHLGVSGQGVLDVDGPVQRHLLDRLGTWVGPVDHVAVDGCGAPAVRVPLASLAHAFARLAIDETFRAVREAGFAHPTQVGGTGRLESVLLAAGVVAKPGAEGIFAAGWVAADGGGRGLAVKASDGGHRGATATAHAVLEGLGVVSGVWTPPAPLGGGQPQGTVRAAPSLRAAIEASSP